MTYTSHADLGGTLGRVPVVPEPEGELFHAAWEPRVLALTLAMGATGTWNLDMSRAARETLPEYERLGYYAIWLEALCALLLEHGLVHADELAAGHAFRPGRPLPRWLSADQVPGALAKGSSTERTITRPARFAPGQTVRMRDLPAEHHTRLPGYARGKQGVIERLNGMHVFADAHAQGAGEDPQWLYTVVFDGAQLWSEASRGLRVSIDAWEPYLEDG